MTHHSVRSAPPSPPDSKNPADPWLDATGAAAHIGIKSRTSVNRLARTDPSFPRPNKLHDKHARWRMSWLDAWLELRVTKIEIENAARIAQARKLVERSKDSVRRG